MCVCTTFSTPTPDHTLVLRPNATSTYSIFPFIHTHMQHALCFSDSQYTHILLHTHTAEFLLLGPKPMHCSLAKNAFLGTDFPLSSFIPQLTWGLLVPSEGRRRRSGGRRRGEGAAQELEAVSWVCARAPLQKVRVCVLTQKKEHLSLLMAHRPKTKLMAHGPQDEKVAALRLH